MKTRSKKLEHKVEPEPETESEEEVLDQDQEEDQEEGWKTGSWDDEDEEGSELDEDTLMDLGYAVANTLATDKPVPLNIHSPSSKPTPNPTLDTPNVCHPLSPGAVPADGSPYLRSA